MEKLSVVPLITPCPHCGAKPHVVAGPYHNEETKLHQIFYVEPMERYRKMNDGDTWHFSPFCSKWPVDNFVELEYHPSIGAICNECRALRSESQ